MENFKFLKLMKMPKHTVFMNLKLSYRNRNLFRRFNLIIECIAIIKKFFNLSVNKILNHRKYDYLS